MTTTLLILGRYHLQRSEPPARIRWSPATRPPSLLRRLSSIAAQIVRGRSVHWIAPVARPATARSCA